MATFAFQHVKNHVIFWIMTSLSIPLLVGFIYFTGQFSGSEALVGKKADAIVVFTGARKRIDVGLNLYAKKAASRILISGVNTNISRKYLAKRHSRYSKLIRCCVSLDYQALDTVGNARETAKWVREENIKSLIVVTSGYHLPRSMLLLKRELPDVQITAHSVTSTAFDQWWTNYKSTKTVTIEYFKYVASLLNMELAKSVHNVVVAKSF